MNFTELLKHAIDIVLHIDRHLAQIVSNYNVWTYGILFLVVFCETGLVVTPFLPGDSLLFAAGSLAGSLEGKGILSPHLLFLIITCAAIAGDNLNYWIGHYVGPKVFSQKSKFFKKEYLDKTHAFYVKHGGKTVIIARFVPIVRTFSPFVAGVGVMPYGRFLINDIAGGILWVGIFVYAGYFFGTLPIVKENFSLVIVAIIIISVFPIVIEYLRSRRKKAISV